MQILWLLFVLLVGGTNAHHGVPIHHPVTGIHAADSLGGMPGD